MECPSGGDGESLLSCGGDAANTQQTRPTWSLFSLFAHRPSLLLHGQHGEPVNSLNSPRDPLTRSSHTPCTLIGFISTMVGLLGPSVCCYQLHSLPATYIYRCPAAGAFPAIRDTLV